MFLCYYIFSLYLSIDSWMMEEDSKRSEFVPLHGIMTHVLKYGNTDQSKYLYLIIPGQAEFMLDLLN